MCDGEGVEHEVREERVTIVGVLKAADGAHTPLACRVETTDASVPCTFDPSLVEQVQSALDDMVVASGVGKVLPSGVIGELRLTLVTVLARPRPASLAELQLDQEVEPWRDGDERVFEEPLTEAEAKAFLEAVRSCRTDG